MGQKAEETLAASAPSADSRRPSRERQRAALKAELRGAETAGRARAGGNMRKKTVPLEQLARAADRIECEKPCHER